MNETLLIWLISGAYGFIFLIGVSGVGFNMLLVQRVTRLEAVMALFGEKAAKILHSPHTPELDRLLEKYCDRDYQLEPEEWKRLLEITADIENNDKLPKEQRALAAIVHAIASNTLYLPAPKPHKHV